MLSIPIILWCLVLTQFKPRSTREIAATAVRRVIDEETVLHEAAICSLKFRRNTYYSSTSALHPEILARIFLAAKSGVRRYGTLKEASWLNVAGVCQEWRNIALASPQMWSSVNLSRPDRALEWLKRSKSAPLQINCRTVPLKITEANEGMVKSIMAEVGRIQELDISATTQNEIIRFLSLNRTASAPLLEHLLLKALDPSSASLPPDIMHREMPSLRRIDLQNINISKFPPFPHLTSLKISLSTWSTMRPSSLLSSLQYSPKLEEIDITGMVKDDPADSPKRVKLPNLSRISITANDLEASSIFANLEYPPSATVAFANRTPPLGEPDFSNLAKMCRRFLEPGAPAIRKVKIDGAQDGPCRLEASYRGHPGSEEDFEEDYEEDSDDFSISLAIAHRHYSAACVALCSALPLETVSTLEVAGFHGMTLVEWKTLFHRCKHVKDLHFNTVLLSLFQTLMNSKSTKSPLPLPKLETIEITLCTFIEPDDRYAKPETSSLFNYFEQFLKQRKSLKMPVKHVSIVLCQITQKAVAKLEKYSEVYWDGEEAYWNEEEEEGDYDSDDLDDMYGFAGL